jgi:hypothetical protein
MLAATVPLMAALLRDMLNPSGMVRTLLRSLRLPFRKSSSRRYRIMDADYTVIEESSNNEDRNRQR